MGSRGPSLRSAVAAAAGALTCASVLVGPAATSSASTPSAGPATVSTARAPAEPAPRPGRSVPSQDEVTKAQEAAAATAEEVARISAQVAAAEARLRVLQQQVAQAVAADERAARQLADARTAEEEAADRLAAARVADVAAGRALSGTAADMYMQGNDVQDLATLLLSPPNVMADLAVVLDQDAAEVRTRVDAARSATAEATAREQGLVAARTTVAARADAARTARAAAEAGARKAAAEATRLSTRQERLAARLAELEEGAEDLVARREAAARLGRFDVLGLQADGGAPRLAQEIARKKVAALRWDGGQFTCLVSLWNAESGWSWSAANPSSGAYGIPQSLPGWKMASAGDDWLTNPATQIDWGLRYIRGTYGSPCAAHDAFLSRSPHWY